MAYQKLLTDQFIMNLVDQQASNLFVLGIAMKPQCSPYCFVCCSLSHLVRSASPRHILKLLIDSYCLPSSTIVRKRVGLIFKQHYIS